MVDFSQYKVKKSPSSSEFDQYKASINPSFEQEDPGAYLDNLPKPEGFWSKLPRNILTGLTHAGRNLHNLPHDLVQVAEKGAQGIGSVFDSLPGANPRKGKPLSEYLPYDESNYADVFGGNPDTNTLMDSLIQKGLEYGPEIVSGAGGARSLLRRFPITRRGASRQLRQAQNLINERNINNFQMNYPLLEEASNFLPRTRASGEMMQGILNGEYGPAFALQSQIGHHARDLARSPLASERLLAPQARELKQTILHEMEQALRSTGHHEEADLLRGGIHDYRNYMRFRERVLPVLKKIGIPTTGLAALGLGTKKGRGLLTKTIENIID